MKPLGTVKKDVLKVSDLQMQGIIFQLVPVKTLMEDWRVSSTLSNRHKDLVSLSVSNVAGDPRQNIPRSLAHFKLGEPVGRGLMGKVHEYRCSRTGHKLAVKVMELRPDGANESDISARLKYSPQEAAIAPRVVDHVSL
jgi:hypothetical protein